MANSISKTAAYFHISQSVGPVNEKIHKILNKYLLGVFVARAGGDILYSKQFQQDVKLSLMSSFIAALSMFGEESLGSIKSIFVEGLNIEMTVVAKHDLVLTMLFRPNMVKDRLNEECERGLDAFHDRFKDEIENGCQNQAMFRSFDETMVNSIHKYLIKIGAL